MDKYMDEEYRLNYIPMRQLQVFQLIQTWGKASGSFFIMCEQIYLDASTSRDPFPELWKT